MKEYLNQVSLIAENTKASGKAVGNALCSVLSRLREERPNEVQ